MNLQQFKEKLFIMVSTFKVLSVTVDGEARKVPVILSKECKLLDYNDSEFFMLADVKDSEKHKHLINDLNKGMLKSKSLLPSDDSKFKDLGNNQYEMTTYENGKTYTWVYEVKF